MEEISAIIGRVLARLFSDASALAGGRISKGSDEQKSPADEGAPGEFGETSSHAESAGRAAG